jgi:hypothetical protein
MPVRWEAQRWRPRACVAIIDITNKDLMSEFLRVPYDIEKAASAISRAASPHFADRLRKRGRRPLSPYRETSFYQSANHSLTGESPSRLKVVKFRCPTGQPFPRKLLRPAPDNPHPYGAGAGAQFTDNFLLSIHRNSIKSTIGIKHPRKNSKMFLVATTTQLPDRHITQYSRFVL